MITDLSYIAEAASQTINENEEFRVFLKNIDTELVDQVIFELNSSVSAAIDCTACGNCCRSFMINVTTDEAEKVAGSLSMTSSDFKKDYLEESLGGQLIVNTIPCHFLVENKCSIYANRFNECREFPHLHRPNVSDRLFGLLMYYSTCPIIFNVMEQAKEKLSFCKTNVLG